MVKALPPSRFANLNTRLENLTRCLQRAYTAERQLTRVIAARFVDAHLWEVKRQLAQDMWETSRHADVLHSRLSELPQPRRDLDTWQDPDVLALMLTCVNAADTEAFITGVYGAVIPELIRAYSHYLDQADGLADAPTVYALRHVVADKRAQVERMQAVTARYAPTLFENHRRWQIYIQDFVMSIGGIFGQNEGAARPVYNENRPPYQIGRTVARDARWSPVLFHLPHENKYDVEGRKAWRQIEALDQRVAIQVWTAISHFNELWSAEVIASAMWDLDQQPWAFYRDLARWAWDSVRHCQMGYRALQGWGWDVPELIPWASGLYNAVGPMSPMHRLALLYYYETNLTRAGTKQIELKILESADDEGRVQDMDYDMADRALHEQYGAKWLRHLLGGEQVGDEQLEHLTDEARDILARYVKGHQADPEAQLAPFFNRLYDVIVGMLEDLPDDGLEIEWVPVVADEEVLQDL